MATKRERRVRAREKHVQARSDKQAQGAEKKKAQNGKRQSDKNETRINSKIIKKRQKTCTGRKGKKKEKRGKE